jgi:hypothetical protein
LAIVFALSVFVSDFKTEWMYEFVFIPISLLSAFRFQKRRFGYPKIWTFIWDLMSTCCMPPFAVAYLLCCILVSGIRRLVIQMFNITVMENLKCGGSEREVSGYRYDSRQEQTIFSLTATMSRLTPGPTWPPI